MNIKRLLWLIVALASLSYSCTNEEAERADNLADRTANGWIYGIMQDNYLWQDDLPGNPEYGENYYYFFKSLLSDNDGKHYGTYDYYYSYIYRYIPEENLLNTRADEEYYRSGYGFNYIITQSLLYDPLVSTDNRFLKKYATVAYVVPGSAADSARLSRGDHIYKIGGKEIPQTHYNSLLGQLTAAPEETSTVTFTVCELTQVGTDTATLVEEGFDVTLPVVTRGEEVRDITLTSTRIDQSPVSYFDTYDVGGTKVGYLLYNEFENGGSGEYYDQQLKQAFQDLKSDGATELVLDLRYNPGGYVSSCQLLASLIVPPSFTNSVFQLNRRFDGSTSQVLFTSQPYTLSLDRVYVLTSGNSASASEALIHGLRGAGIEVIQIGSRTEGKNVGMTQFTTRGLAGTQAANLSPFVYEAYPVTFYVEDRNGVGYSPVGLEPDHIFYEEFITDFLPLGSRQEPMLKIALDLISGNSSGFGRGAGFSIPGSDSGFASSDRDAGFAYPTAAGGQRIEVRLSDKVKPARPYLE